MQNVELVCSGKYPAVALDSQLKDMSSALFKLGERQCLAVQDDLLDRLMSEQRAAIRNGKQDGEAGHQIVGEFALAGVRYIVLCSTPPTGNVTEPTPVESLLTSRELQIARLVAKGRLNKQIAGQLKVSEWTVSTHLRRIYAKLGVHTRAAMVARVMLGELQG